MAADPISAGLDVIAAAATLAAKIQDEKNTPQMVEAVKRQAHQDLDQHRDKLETIVSDQKQSKEKRDAAFQILQILDS